jgi:hypothetical protein
VIAVNDLLKLAIGGHGIGAGLVAGTTARGG